jgi:MFS transporter, AAHS family, 4-hydroxybenzoate transporter
MKASPPPPAPSPAQVSDAPPVVDVARLIEERPLGWFAVRLVVVCWLITFFDGYDTNVVGFANPYLAPEFHLDKAMLSYVALAGNFGALVGGFLFGFLGDRIGRRPAIILATLLFGVLTLGLSFAGGYYPFLLLRLLNGIALGGAIPLTWALGTEYVPTRYRATTVTLIMLGYSLGFASGGPLSVRLQPEFGWRALFSVGGAASLLAAGILFWALPESLRFLVTRRPGSAQLRRALERALPGGVVPANARIVLPDETHSSASREGLALLFRGRLARITPCIWLGYLASSMAIFFLTFWGPTVYGDLGFSHNAAAWLTSAMSLAGMSGGLAIMRFTDRIGVSSLAVLPAMAVPLLVLTGFAPASQAVFAALIVSLGVFLNGGHYGVQSIAGLFYPTSCRALGTGWASTFGKVGSVIGPTVGGLILASGLKTQHLFALMAICPATLFLCLIGIARVQAREPRTSAAPVSAAS